MYSKFIFILAMLIVLLIDKTTLKAAEPSCGCYPQYYTKRIIDDINGNRDTIITMNQDSSIVLDTCYIEAPHTISCGDKIRYMKNLYGVYFLKIEDCESDKFIIRKIVIRK